MSVFLSAPTPIKSLPEVTKVLCSLIVHSTKDFDCSDACKFVSRHCWNGSSHIKGIYFEQSYSAVAYADSFRTNIDIVAMHILTDRILDVGDAFQNTKSTIYEIVCVGQPRYYID